MDIVYRYDPFRPIGVRNCNTAAEASAALREGNRRYERIVETVRREVLDGGEGQPIIIPSSPLSLGFSLVDGKPQVQRPFGIVLGCSDARAPIEIIFDLALNELFVVRVAGNVLATECLGSIEYAARSFSESVKLVVVLGHSGCGAVGAAVDLYLEPVAYGAIAVTHALRSIIDRISFVVRIADEALRNRCGPAMASDPGYKAALWHMAVYMNAALTAQDLARELDSSSEEGLQVVYGVYDLATQRVEAAPGHEDTFARAPKGVEDFSILADLLVDSILASGMVARPGS